MLLVWVPPVAALVAFAFVYWIARTIQYSDKGTEDMQRVAGTIMEGARAFLNRQYRTIAAFAIVVAIVLSTVLAVLQGNLSLGLHTIVAFLVGATCSGFAGFTGMYIAVRANLRTAAAARTSVGGALTMALRGGAVSAFLVVALSVLGVFVLFGIYGTLDGHPENAPNLIVGFAFGASFVALFAQLGGGIYTKAADVGADLVGKVEAGIPEDDPRNPAVIADLVGDNVGDCAGRGADLFESISAENIGAMILGAALYRLSPDKNIAWIILPLVVTGAGLIASMIGLLSVRPNNVKNPSRALDLGYWVSAGLSFIFLAIIISLLNVSYWFLAAGTVGLLLSIAFVYITQYYTSGTWRPVKEIARASLTGPATTIIEGLAVAFETPAVPVIAIVCALVSSYALGTQAAPADATAAILRTYGIYGTAVATMGMLMVAAYILAMDTFGPITDNAAGIAEMSQAASEVRDTMDELDSLGNTTKALTKGYAVGSAALAAFLLFSAYLDTVGIARHTAALDVVNLANVQVFAAALIGAALIFLFSSLAIRAVGKAARAMIEEVRRQFKNDPGIMQGTSRPDYARCVDISTVAALREMVGPGVLAIGTPIIVGLIFRAEAEAAFLMVATMTGIIMANVMNNGGGAWDNGKKYIEAGLLKDDDGNVHGKRTPAHEAAVVGDTVGDPFKDTAGPSLHILIKLLATLTLVLAPLFV